MPDYSELTTPNRIDRFESLTLWINPNAINMLVVVVRMLNAGICREDNRATS